jgi:hypothetical protein
MDAGRGQAHGLDSIISGLVKCAGLLTVEISHPAGASHGTTKGEPAGGSGEIETFAAARPSLTAVKSLDVVGLRRAGELGIDRADMRVVVRVAIAHDANAIVDQPSDDVKPCLGFMAQATVDYLDAVEEPQLLR